jgi:dTMP kinase
LKTRDSASLTRGGWIISIEGVDAVGKSTQSLRLQTWFKRKGVKVSSLSFPDYETPIGREIKAFLAGKRTFQAEVRHMLFAANRWEKLAAIRGSQIDNEVVIVNRYTESNLVYGVANGLRLEWLAALEQGMPKSDLVVVLDAPSTALTSRRPGPKDSYERDHEMQLRVQSLYRELAPRFGWIIVDGSGSVRGVHDSIIKVVKGSLDARLRAKL